MPDLTGLRIHPLATIAASSRAAALGGVALSAAPAASRYILRGEATVSPAGAVLGIDHSDPAMHHRPGRGSCRALARPG